MNSLQILKKLRKYELEKEEHQLMLEHKEVHLRLQALDDSQKKLQVDLLAKKYFQSTSLLQRFDAHFVESEQVIATKTDEHQKSILKRDQQIQTTLLSKQRHDMIERILENRSKIERIEEENRERKFLDDISQTRYAMGIAA